MSHNLDMPFSRIDANISIDISNPMEIIQSKTAIEGMIIAFIIAMIAALLFPAQGQSKLWIKIFGAEWGAISNGRIWTWDS